MTMFRVLSEEESRNVTRWQAPNLGADASKVARTRQQASPRQPDSDAGMTSLLGGMELKRGTSSIPSSAPRLQSINQIDVLASHMAAQAAPSEQQKASANEVSAAASAQMLQSSYDEGYNKGYAEGNAALHQHCVRELRAVIKTLGNAEHQRDDNELEDELVALSLDIARLVIQKEIKADKTVIRDIIAKGLDQLPGSSTAVTRVKLHPLDATIAREYMIDDATVKFIDDPTLDRGACHIESGSSIVKAGVDDWLINIAEQLGLNAEPLTHATTSDSPADDGMLAKSPDN